MGLKILDINSYIPEKEIYNDFFEDYLDTTKEWITQRTGIVKRNFSDKGLSFMLKEAIKGLDKNKFDKNRIKLVLSATISPDYIMPSISVIVHQEMDLNENVFSADINMACTGYVGILMMAENMLEVGECAVCIGAERLSSIINFEDRSTAMLFGDGAAVSVVMKTNEEFVKVYGTLPSEDLYLETGGKVGMNGKQIYKFATGMIPKIINEILDKSKKSLEDIDEIVLHQANLRIIESVAKKIGNEDKFYSNISRYGNTSSASIGLCLADMKKEEFKGKNLMLVAFGGGLTYAGTIVEWG